MRTGQTTKKKYLLLRLFLLFVLLQHCAINMAQTTLSGKVTDMRQHLLPSVSLMLIDSKDTARKWFAVSDSSGYFFFKQINKGLYSLRATSTGYKAGGISFITIGERKAYLLPDIILGDTSGTLQAVIVRAKKMPVEIDKGKIVFNIQNDATTSGLTAFDVIKKLPGVTVDQNENIILSGSTGVNVLVDGKMTYLSGIQLTNYLKGISAEDINKIELNLTPSAEYDAAGNAGIINIVPKKNLKNGFAVDVRSSVTKGKYWVINENVSASRRSEKLSLYGSLDYKTPNSFWNSSSGNTINDNGKSTELKRNNQSIIKVKYYTWHAGGEWQFLPKHRLSFDYLGYLDDWKNSKPSIVENVDEHGNLLSSVHSVNNLYEPYHYDGITLNYRFDIDTIGKKIIAETQYISYRNYSDGTLTTLQYDAAGNFTGSNILLSHQPGFRKIRSAKADADLPFKTFSLKAGLKYAEVTNDNPYHFDSLYAGRYVEIEEMSNHYKYKEQIAAAYVSASKKIKKISIDAGLRLEYTKAESYTIKQDISNHWEYSNLFPSFSVGQEINENDKINLSASRRINRPSYGNLNLIRWYVDQYFYYTGNPSLVPEMAWIFSTAYTWKRKYVFTATYGITDNYTNAKLTMDSIAVKSQPANLGQLQRFDVIASLPLQILSFWDIQLTPSVSYMSYPISQLTEDKTLSKWSATVSAQQQITLPAGIKMDIFSKYSSAALRGIYETHSFFYTDIGFKKSFFNNKFDAQISLTNIFNSVLYRGVSLSNVADYHYKDWGDTRRIGITLHYHFGSDLLKGKNKKTEEEERL